MQELEQKLESALEFTLYKQLNDTTGEVEGLHPIIRSKMYTVRVEHNAAEEQWFDTKYYGEHPKLDIEYGGWMASLKTCKYDDYNDSYCLEYFVQGYATNSN